MPKKKEAKLEKEKKKAKKSLKGKTGPVMFTKEEMESEQ